MPPTGNFSRPELCCQKRWRRIQHIVNELWACLRKKYLQSLEPRTKWKSGKRNFSVGDIVLVFQNESIQNKWPMARLIQVFKDINGYVGNVKLRIRETRICDEVSTVFLWQKLCCFLFFAMIFGKILFSTFPLSVCINR